MIELIRQLSAPLAPRPVAGCLPRLARVGGVRGVLFDVYGTLLISAAGDIGSGAASWEAKCAAMTAALDDAGVAGAAPGAAAMLAALEAAIRAEHTAARGRGVAYPEVDLRELWRRLLPGAGTAAVERAAVSYECRTNPVWPMPGAAAAVAALQARGPVGIVSNAQFFTPLVLAALLPGGALRPAADGVVVRGAGGETVAAAIRGRRRAHGPALPPAAARARDGGQRRTQ